MLALRHEAADLGDLILKSADNPKVADMLRRRVIAMLETLSTTV